MWKEGDTLNKHTKIPAVQGLVLGLCGTAVFLIFFATVWEFRRDAIFPPPHERYDITEAFFAPTAEVCPEIKLWKNLSVVEKCSSKLSIDRDVGAFHKLRIPRLNDLPIHSYPRLIELFEQQNFTKGIAAIRGKKPLIMGFRIPRDLFKTDELGADPNILTIAQIRDGRICYLGSCPYFLNRQMYLTVRLPLTYRSEIKTPYVDIWVHLVDTDGSIILNLEHGIFVTSLSKLQKVDRVHIPFIKGLSLFDALVIFSIFIISFAFSFLWFDYIDFSSFSILVGSVFLSRVCSILNNLQPIVIGGRPLSQTLGIWVELLVVVASIFFAIATLRPDPIRFWLWWKRTFLIALFTFPVIDFTIFTSSANLRAHLALALVSLLVPSLICILGGFSIKNAKAKSDPLKNIAMEERTKRYREQWLLGICLFGAAMPVVLRRIINQTGLWTYDFSSFRGLALFPIFTALLYTASRTFRRRTELYQKQLVKATKQAAVGDLIQMLAHDVRKPFSLLRIGLDLLRKSSTPSEIHKVATLLIPQVGKSLQNVTSMLEDIMTVNAPLRLSTQPTKIKNLLLQSMTDVFSLYPNADISFRYRLDHHLPIDLDSAKMLRVINNIIDNAVQAMHEKGTMWFECQRHIQNSKAYVKIVIGNSGSFIEREKIEKIFDAFFTHGKKNGTGLGLAVAKAFVEIHGGSIACRSNVGEGTEFEVVLPILNIHPFLEIEDNLEDLPKNSHQIKKIGDENAPKGPESGNPDDRKLHQAIERSRTILKRQLRILVVDDEPVYTSAILSMIKSQGLEMEVQVFELHQAEDVMAILSEWKPEIVLLDIDLGNFRKNGFEIVQDIRSSGSSCYIGIHTNRMLEEDRKTAKNHGANGFFPKPIQKKDLAAIINSALDLMDIEPNTNHLAEKNKAENYVFMETNLTNDNVAIVMVDDDPFVREAWSHALQIQSFYGFDSPSQFLNWAEKNTDKIPTIRCLILDFYFMNDIDGETLARELRSQTAKSAFAKIPIVLCTDGARDSMDNTLFEAMIPKDPISLKDLLEILVSKVA